LPFVENISAF